MKRCIYFSVSDKNTFLNKLKRGNFVEINEIWDFGFKTEPYSKFELSDNFPSCCEFHSNVMKDAENWFKEFPNCCDYHKELSFRPWFKKENYKHLPLKIVLLVEYTQNFIGEKKTERNWYKEITDYIEYSIDSFGSPSIGMHIYVAHLKYWVDWSKDIEPSKKKRIIDYLDSNLTISDKPELNLNLLKETFQKWLKTFPNLAFFNETKSKLKGALPFNLLPKESSYNRFTKTTKFRVRTQFELIELLIDLTKNLLKSFNSTDLIFDKGVLNQKDYNIDLLNEEHRIKQSHLLENYTKNEEKYIKIIKKWLKNEKEYISKIHPLINIQKSMPKLFETEIRKISDNRYLKVFLRDKNKNSSIASQLMLLESVKNANVTQNNKEDITVYPAKTYTVEETENEVSAFLSTFLTGGKLDPVFTDSENNLSNMAYEAILERIYNYGRNLEKFKKLYEKFDEEGFRDFFLPHLNSISKGNNATGETFNKIGKTDILIQDNNGLNVFIAECKLWGGEKKLLEAIDQLFERYVTWRDEKVSLIIFNKKMKNFSELLNKASEKMKEHRLFYDYLGERKDTSFKYVFKNYEDENKRVMLELIVFNCI